MNAPDRIRTIACKACGASPVVIFAPPMCDSCENKAREAWKAEHPGKRVEHARPHDRRAYRERVVRGARAPE